MLLMQALTHKVLARAVAQCLGVRGNSGSKERSVPVVDLRLVRVVVDLLD
jgi:hypothetical protein